MLLIVSSRKMDMEVVMQHPLRPLPWALSNCDGSLKKTSKAAMARRLEKRMSSQEKVALPSATIIDVMTLVQKLKGDNHIFGELSDHLITNVLNA